jgi:hypothetical protein
MGVVADIRYLQPTIPALIYLGVAVLSALPFGHDWPRVAFGALLFLTNLVNSSTARVVGGSVFPLRSTLVSFAGELMSPPPTPYRTAADWLNRNVPPGRSAWVHPDHAVYPLMYHAPHVTYAWQFEPRADDEFFMLPQIHFREREEPDYLIAFGVDVREVRRVMQTMRARGAMYELTAHLPVHFPDLTRPELYWRSFTEIPVTDAERDGVFVFVKR